MTEEESQDLENIKLTSAVMLGLALLAAICGLSFLAGAAFCVGCHPAIHNGLLFMVAICGLLGSVPAFLCGWYTVEGPYKKRVIELKAKLAAMENDAQ